MRFEEVFLLSEEAAENEVSECHDYDLAVERPCWDRVCKDEVKSGERENAQKICCDLDDSTPLHELSSGTCFSRFSMPLRCMADSLH